MSLTSNAVALLIAATLFALIRADHSVRATSFLDNMVLGSPASTIFLIAHLAFILMTVLAVVFVCKIAIRRVPVAPIPAPLPPRKVYFEKNTLPPLATPTYPPISITMPLLKTPELPVFSAIDDSMEWEATVTTPLMGVPEFPVSSPSATSPLYSASIEALTSRLDSPTMLFATGAFGCSTSHQRRRKAEAARAAEAALQPKPYSRFSTRWCHPDLYKLEASKDRPAPLKSALKVTSSDLPKKVHWQHTGLTVTEVRMVGIYQTPLYSGRPSGSPLDSQPDRHGLVLRQWKTDANGFISHLLRQDEVCPPPSFAGLYGTDDSQVVAQSRWAGRSAFHRDRSETNAILARAEREEQARAAVYDGKSGGRITYFT